MRKWSILVAVVVILALLLACGPTAPSPEPSPKPGQIPLPEPAPPPVVEVPPEKANLTPTPVETAMPQYGGTITYGGSLARSFDGHQDVGYGPMNQLPTFNQLVMFDLAYKDTVPDNIIGDLAESWEVSPDGTEITFKLHQGVKWHDGMPFTADDVVYSLDKMNDVNRSAIAARTPAYESAEKIDDYTVKVHLKYASGGFMVALALGDAVIEAKHLAGTDDQSAEFMIGTGPFILVDYKVRVHLRWKRNPDYFKKDKYGNQLPYLDGLQIVAAGGAGNEMLIARRTDMKTPVSSVTNRMSYDELVAAAPELVYQPKISDWGAAIYLNLKHKPLDDIRVRRAMGMVIDEDSLIIGYSQDPMFGITDTGLLAPSFGLPKEEVKKLMGWDKPMEERVAEAQKLMAEAGYPNGFKLNMMSSSRTGAATTGYIGVNLIFADALRKYLNIDVEVHGVAGTEMQQRLDEDNYDTYTQSLSVGQDPGQLLTYFGTGIYGNWSNYSNPEFDRMIAGLDHIIDSDKRREAIWDIERLLLTDLPALPTGCFITNYMAAYPYVKNLRYLNMSYSRACGFDEVWIDKDEYVKIHGKLPSETFLSTD